MSPTPEKQAIGLPVGDFSLALLTGGVRTLGDYLEGKRGLVTVFWSYLCSHCLRYDDYLNAFARKHPDIGLVAIASRHGESSDQLRAAAAERKLLFPILHDSHSAVARQWYTQQTPRAFLIGQDRTLHYRGAIDNFRYADHDEYVGYLEPAIASFLAGEPVTRPETASFGCAIQSVYYVLPQPLK
ncbi:MAG: redoxin domain-containing protein [Bryobacteraceae bacterium]